MSFVHSTNIYKILKYGKWSEVNQSCPTLCDPMDCSLPGSSVHWIFQARVLEWVVISFSRGSSQPRDWTRVSCIVSRRFTVWATRDWLNAANTIKRKQTRSLNLIIVGKGRHTRWFGKHFSEVQNFILSTLVNQAPHF